MLKLFCWMTFWTKFKGSGNCETKLNIPYHMVWCPKGINWLMCTFLQWQIIFCKLISKWQRIYIATPRSSIQTMVGTPLIKLMLGIFKTVMCTNNVRCKKYDSWFDYASARESQVAESCKKIKKLCIPICESKWLPKWW